MNDTAMATTPLPADIDNLFTLAADMADGLHQLETALGIQANTEAALRADLVVVSDAHAAFLTANAAKKSLTTSQTVADSNGKAFIGSDLVFMAIVTVADSEVSLNSVPSGATVNVRVTAINAAGESAPSAIVQIVVP